MSTSALTQGLFEPVAGPGLDEILSPDKSVAILIDDHSRPTPVQKPLASVLRFIEDAGVPAARTKIVVAMGTHLLGDERLLREKLGNIYGGEVEIVINECAKRRALVGVGQLDDGHPLLVNRVFGNADVKITVSGVYPHDDVGYSGGAKILMGAFGLTTLSALHRKHPSVGRGAALETTFRTELEAIADRIGIDYSINLVLDPRKQITAAVSGPFRSAFRQAAEFVARQSAVTVHGDFDVVVSNAYPFDASVSVLGKSYWPFVQCRNTKVEVVMTSLCERSGGRLPWSTSEAERWLHRIKEGSGLRRAKRIVLSLRERLSGAGPPGPRRIVFAPRPSSAGTSSRKSVEGMPVYHSWNDVTAVLEEGLSSQRPRVALFPWAPLLYPRGGGEALATVQTE